MTKSEILKNLHLLDTTYNSIISKLEKENKRLEKELKKMRLELEWHKKISEFVIELLEDDDKEYIMNLLK